MSVPSPIAKVRPRVAPTELQFWWSPPPVKMLVAGGTVNSILISTDGITWTPSVNNPFPGGQANAVAWNGSVWAAIADGGDIAISTDGDTWTAATTNPLASGQGYGIAWNGTYWVAVGSASGGTVSIITSTDGDSWFAASTNPLTRGNGVAWNGTYWVAVGQNSDFTISIVKSTDGDTWTAASSNPFGSNGNGVAWSASGTYWVAVGYGPSNTECIAKSTDGETWTVSTNNPFYGAAGVGRGIAWNASYWVAVGTDATSTTIAKSFDGMTWTQATDNPFGNDASWGGRGISWNGSYWVAVGSDTSRTFCIATSTNGMTWTNIPNNELFVSYGAFGVANNLSLIESITGYVLESVSPSVTQSVGPSTRTTTITGLTNLTDYSFTIKTDISGSYSSTAPFRTVRTSAKPGAVATLTKSQSIVGGLLTVTFSWTNPGDYAYFYVYSLKIATGNKDTIFKGTRKYSTLSHTFTGLDPARSYSFEIERGNDAGYSVTSSLTTTPVYFNPTTIAGLNFWVDAADVSGNGSSVSDGTVITSWKDKSGTSNDATATTGATLQTDSVGRYLNFTGSSWYSLAESSWAYGEYFTFFVVDKPVDYTGSYTLISNQEASTDSLNITYNTADGIRLSTDGDTAALGNAFQGVTAPVNIWCFTNYGGKTAYWNKLISGKAVTEAFITDSLLSIGAVEGSTNFYNGRMREILMYSGIMSEESRETITTYLYNKWSTQPNTFPQNPVANSTVLWLDAQDITTFFQDLSGTVPVIGNFNTVLLWKDKSGFENDIYCNDGSEPAIYYTSALNNLPAFDTNAAGGTIQTNNYLQSGDATLFLVADKLNAIDYYFQHDILNIFGLTQTDDEINTISWHQSATDNNNRFADGEVPFIFYGKMQKGQLLSGTFITSSGIKTSYTVEPLSLTVSAAPIKLNSNNSVNYGEVIYYNRALTDAEIQTNAVYLSNKWRIAIPTVVAFSPQQISGMKLWLDASDPYTVFENDGVLTVWKDRSGNGNNASPFGSPTLNNGIVFDGSGQWLTLPDGALPQDNYSYYIVSKLVGDSAIISGGSRDISGQMWVAVGSGGIRISFDGLRWINSTNAPFSGASGYGISWNGSYWVAVGNNTGSTVCIAKSTDGMTWTDASNNPFSGAIGYGIAWNGTYWVAVGFNNSTTVAIATSTDGDTWTDATDNPFSGGQGNGIAWNGTYWVAVGLNSGNTVAIAKSTDGDTWTDASNNPFSGGQGKGIAWNGSYWVAVGFNSDNTVSIAKSTDGMTWTDASNNPFSGSVGYGVAWNGSYWVAVGTNTANTVSIAKSTDGMTWANATNNLFSGGAGFGIAWSASGSYWVAVGNNSDNTVGVAISTDGLIWTPSINNPYTGSYGLGIASGIAPIHNSLTTITATTVPSTTTYLAKTIFDTISAVSALEDTNIIPNNTTVIIESIYDGTNKSLFLSGITGATDTSIHSQDASNNFIGKDLSGGYMNGTIKEILVYSTAHTTGQREQVEQYLKNKWYPDTYTPTGTSLWLDSASASNFTLSGSSVQVWKDKSAQSTDYSQSYAWAQPLYSLDSVTGRYGVRFGAYAIATGLTNATSPFGATSSWSVFAVQRYDYSTDQSGEVVNDCVCTPYDISGNAPTTFKVGTTYVVTPSTSELIYIREGGVFAANVEIHKRPVLTTQYVNSLEYADFYNGTAGETASLTQAMTTAGKLNIGFAGALTPALAGAMRGYIYELIVFKTAITTETRQAVEGYLAWKWGIQDLLATTHPYYLAPPQ